MRCKGCGIQLSANNLDNCPNCGTPEEQGKKDRLPQGVMGLFFNLPGLAGSYFLFSVIVGGLVYVATGSIFTGGGVLLGLLAVGALGFLAMIDTGG